MRQLPQPVWSRLIHDHLRREHAPIPPDYWEAMQAQAHRVANAIRVCREFLPVHPVEAPGIQVPGRRVRGPMPGSDAPIELRIVHHDFSVPAAELAPEQPAAATADAATICALAEDHLVLNGQPQLGTPGLLAAAGQRLSLAGWRRSGVLADLVEQATRLLADAGHGGPHALVISPELDRCLDDQPLQRLHCQNVCAGGLHVTQVLTSPAAVVVTAAPDTVDVAVAQDLTLGYLGQEGSQFHFRALAILALRLKEPAGVCALQEGTERQSTGR